MWKCYQRTTTESEFDLERVNGDPFDDPLDPVGVLDELLHSQIPLRFCIMSLICWATKEIATIYKCFTYNLRLIYPNDVIKCLLVYLHLYYE